ASFTFGSASCNSTGSNHVVFDHISSLRPLFFAHLGDKHYENIASDNVGLFLAAHDSNMAAANQRAFHAVVPVDYTWDDHDYGRNDSNTTSASRVAANASYRIVAPHYELPNRK